MWGHSHGYLGCPRFSRKENLMGEAGMGAYLEAGIQLMICSRKMGVWNRCFLSLLGLLAKIKCGIDALAIRSLMPVP